MEKRKILIIGAGRSASSLIHYLSEKAGEEHLEVTVGDISLENALKKTENRPHTKGMRLDIFEAEARRKAVREHDLIISMLPARFHLEVAKDALEEGKHMVTASYVSKEMKELDGEVRSKGLVFMNEIGLDPGIDHMSAMKLLDEIRDKGGRIISFQSYTGGLVAPGSDDNLWHYKFTWNPRNVVLAGQGGAAQFLKEGKLKYIPYHKLFRRTEIIEIDGYGKFEAYANRDSLKYQDAYGLSGVDTLFRGTVRRLGFSKAWNVFVQLGMTDDSYVMEDSGTMSYRDFVNAFLPYHPYDPVEAKLRSYLRIDPDDELWQKLEELDIFSREKFFEMPGATPAQLLQKILMDKWTLNPEDKDMIVMLHRIGYEYGGKKRQIESSMVVIGDDPVCTAMSKTVGLPVGIAALKILNGEIDTPGVQIPTEKDIYLPVLKELREYGMEFDEKEVPYTGYNPEQIIG